MNLTLYLTENCNLRCSYCTREKRAHDMSKETVEKAVELAFSRGNSAGICFFGGEPLLKKDLICHALKLLSEKAVQLGIPFRSKITTNGTLIDEEFASIAKRANMQIGFSFDGMMQDDCRRTKEGGATFDLMVSKARLLMECGCDTIAMCVASPDACGKLFASVKLVHDLGFPQMIINPAYGEKVTWTDENFEVLRGQFDLIADYLKELYKKGDKFKVAPLHNKISELIKGINPSQYCHLGIRQLAVAWDGKLYPCTSFLDKPEWCLGSVYEGINETRRLEMTKKCFTPSPCKDCELSSRCTNSCGCANILNTGSPDMIAPVQCEYERMVISLADRLGDEMYAMGVQRFIDFFP